MAKNVTKDAKVATARAAAPSVTPVLADAPRTRRVVVGQVVSDKMRKTVVVEVERQVKHRLYKKYVQKRRRFQAHDEERSAKVGDLVAIVESRPLSKNKRWVVQNILRRANQSPEVAV